MAKYILKKVNGKTIIKTSETNSIGLNTLYSIKAFNFLDNIEGSKNNRKIMIDIFSKLRDDMQFNLISKLYQELLTVKDRITLERMYKTTIVSYDKLIKEEIKTPAYKEKIKALYQNTSDDILNEYAHKLVIEYLQLVIKKLDTKTINYIASKIINNEDKDDLLKDIGEIILDDNKASNIYQLSIETVKFLIKKTYEKNQSHLCFGCPTPILECQKILDIEKKPINEYEFITDGEQTYNKDFLERFIVSGCSLYEKNNTNKKLKKIKQN